MGQQNKTALCPVWLVSSSHCEEYDDSFTQAVVDHKSVDAAQLVDGHLPGGQQGSSAISMKHCHLKILSCVSSGSWRHVWTC
eukprot:1314630-Amphidinium_carterae.1